MKCFVAAPPQSFVMFHLGRCFKPLQMWLSCGWTIVCVFWLHLVWLVLDTVALIMNPRSPRKGHDQHDQLHQHHSHDHPASCSFKVKWHVSKLPSLENPRTTLQQSWVLLFLVLYRSLVPLELQSEHIQVHASGFGLTPHLMVSKSSRNGLKAQEVAPVELWRSLW